MEHKVHRLNMLLVEQINRADSNFNVLDFRPEEIFSSVRVAESALRFIITFFITARFLVLVSYVCFIKFLNLDLNSQKNFDFPFPNLGERPSI